MSCIVVICLMRMVECDAKVAVLFESIDFSSMGGALAAKLIAMIR